MKQRPSPLRFKTLCLILGCCPLPVAGTSLQDPQIPHSTQDQASARPASEDGTLSIPKGKIPIELMKVPELPSYVPTLKEDGSPLTLDREQIVAELRKDTGLQLNLTNDRSAPPPLPRLGCRFHTYSAVNKRWFGKLMTWYRNLAFRFDLKFKSQYWDCDDFSMALNAFADLAQAKTKSTVPPHLVGRLIVFNKHEWANNRTVGMHEIVIFRAENGWFVSEPQNGESIALSKYPNRTNIQEIILF